jgi:hypothetical protein
MLRSTIVLALIALLANPAWAKGSKGGGGGYYVISIPAVQPGDACIAEGIGNGQETKTKDGTPVLAKGVHGIVSARCPDPAFPILASTEKIAPDEVRNAPSRQCVERGARVGDDLVIARYGRVTVLALDHESTQCLNGVEATVIGIAAHRAAQAAQATAAKPAQPALSREPSEAEVRQEYERMLAKASPVKEFHVRHILSKTREDAVAALQNIKAGKPFAEVAAEVSTDSGSRAKGGDLGWSVPSHFVGEFGAAMRSLEPAGLTPEPVHTSFGWHLVEVLEVKMGKDSFPEFSIVKNRIAAGMRAARAAVVPVAAKAVCRKMVAPLQTIDGQGGGKGTVVAEMRVENGRVSEILNLSGPSIHYPAVTAALNKYECDRLDRAVIATQSFEF